MERKIEMITTTDYRRLTSLLDDKKSLDATLSNLEDKLARATVVEPNDAPGDLVTMNSTFIGTTPDAHDDAEIGARTLTLVYPREANIGEGRISIYASLGAELLGSRAGQLVAWKGTDGVMRKLLIDRIVYQPEASGDWHL